MKLSPAAVEEGKVEHFPASSAQATWPGRDRLACLQRAFGDVRYFERLLTRFTVPEELFGPLSISALEQDRYKRHVAGFLPDPLFWRSVHGLAGGWIVDPAGVVESLAMGELWSAHARKFLLSREEYPGLEQLLERVRK